LLLAPFLPHLAEAIHRQAGRRSRTSVHLADWPVLDPAWEDEALLAHMARVRHLAELGLRARAQAGIAQHQVLPGALVGLLEGASWALQDLQPSIRLLADALAVAQVKLAQSTAEYVGWRLALDPDRPVQREVSQADIEAALAELSADDAARLAAQLRRGMSVGLEVSGLAITLLPDEVSISVQARPGLAAAADSEHLVALVVG
jgi:isoleucyl-tRNA synthetase